EPPEVDAEPWEEEEEGQAGIFPSITQVLVKLPGQLRRRLRGSVPAVGSAARSWFGRSRRLEEAAAPASEPVIVEERHDHAGRDEVVMFERDASGAVRVFTPGEGE